MLIACDGCETVVSDRAASCPHCGCPIVVAKASEKDVAVLAVETTAKPAAVETSVFNNLTVATSAAIALIQHDTNTTALTPTKSNTARTVVVLLGVGLITVGAWLVFDDTASKDGVGATGAVMLTLGLIALFGVAGRTATKPDETSPAHVAPVQKKRLPRKRRIIEVSIVLFLMASGVGVWQWQTNWRAPSEAECRKALIGVRSVFGLPVPKYDGDKVEPQDIDISIRTCTQRARIQTTKCLYGAASKSEAFACKGADKIVPTRADCDSATEAYYSALRWSGQMKFEISKAETAESCQQSMSLLQTYCYGIAEKREDLSVCYGLNRSRAEAWKTEVLDQGIYCGREHSPERPGWFCRFNRQECDYFGDACLKFSYVFGVPARDGDGHSSWATSTLSPILSECESVFSSNAALFHPDGCKRVRSAYDGLEALKLDGTTVAPLDDPNDKTEITP